ncbi:MAG TPA: UDP-N-acetylmuramoyl-L-alanine--D-glutamate ligase [Bacteroidales bacterium]|nr:UDP-N-acetylmuramoyl-L-alanine--D-glutamate ligase [Bacteroidales bacterium]HPS71052.1 UDP-N-acetylmuramoyl-L-alanine--D-glutamate ligase [Bacteroidales bacterium]
MNHISAIIDFFANKNILILGFGREGQSTYKFLRKYLPYQHLTIADKKDVNFLETNVTLITGEDYLDSINDFDIVIKTPGISLNKIKTTFDIDKISSQTEIFLKHFKYQTIGITGTKGKSTTSSLIYHILKNNRPNVLLGGNIGIPLFDLIENIDNETIVVTELSAHQLEYVHHAPHISILLNLFQEHLDHFNNFENYVNAKWKIHTLQNKKDIFIYNEDDYLISQSPSLHSITTHNFPFSRVDAIENGAFVEGDFIMSKKNGNLSSVYSISSFQNIPGKHNFYNIMASILACEALNVDPNEITKHISTFQGLEHRIEYVGHYHDIFFYNDSISTIPEATISALEALYNVDTLILGGFDRGIEYRSLYQYLNHHSVSHIIFTGPAGKRMFQEWSEMTPIKQNTYITENFDQVIALCIEKTPQGGKCLLSPAAASYNEFKNFEERGNYFKNKIKE